MASPIGTVGIMAGRVLSNMQEQRERQTQALQEMSQGGNGFRGYGGVMAVMGDMVVGTGKCSDANAEFITFSGNAPRELREGRADAVGFWRLEAEKIYLSVLAPLARFDEKLKNCRTGGAACFVAAAPLASAV